MQPDVPPKPTQSEQNEQQEEEDMLAKEHELEVLRSLIYEEREEHGFKLPTEYGPQVSKPQENVFAYFLIHYSILSFHKRVLKPRTSEMD